MEFGIPMRNVLAVYIFSLALQYQPFAMQCNGYFLGLIIAKLSSSLHWQLNC
jgi:hypothetical protein